MKKGNRSRSAGTGLALGVAMGVAIGVAMDNVGAGIAIGVAIGAALGSTGVFAKKGSEDDAGDEPRDPPG